MRHRFWISGGGQLGARVDFLDFFGYASGPWLFDGHVRGGVFHNEITNDMSRTGVQLFHARHNHTSYVVQGGANIGYRFSTNIAITAGYEAMWLNGVALAPSQVGVTPNFNCGPCPGTIGFRTEDLLIHGAKGVTAHPRLDKHLICSRWIAPAEQNTRRAQRFQGSQNRQIAEAKELFPRQSL